MAPLNATFCDYCGTYFTRADPPYCTFKWAVAALAGMAQIC
jgi:hypothetical protein